MIRTLTGTEAQLRLDLTTLHQRGDLVRFVDRRQLRRRAPWGPPWWAVRVETRSARLLPVPSSSNASRLADVRRAACTAVGLTVGGLAGLVGLLAAVRAHLAELAGIALAAAVVALLAARGGGRRSAVSTGCGCIIIHICGH